MLRIYLLPVAFLALFLSASVVSAQRASRNSDPLPGTARLRMDGDIAFAMVDGVDRFLLKQWDEAAVNRRGEWQELLTHSSRMRQEVPEFNDRRNQLLGMLGAQEPRVPITDVQQVHFHFYASCRECDVYSVTWPAVRNVRGEGLLLVPHTPLGFRPEERNRTVAEEFRSLLSIGRLPNMGSVVIAIPDADQTPEALIGLTPGVAPSSQFPRQIAGAGSYVLVPFLINRALEQHNDRCTISNREFLYRPGFEMGRHLLGYELQRVRGAIDWIEALTWPAAGGAYGIRVAGYGEGGLLALLTGAVDQRVALTGVSGYFGSHPKQWDEPIDRNIFGVWNRFGNAELAALAIGAPPRGRVVIEISRGPAADLPGTGGGAPSELRSPTLREAQLECDQLLQYVGTRQWVAFEPMDRMFGSFEWVSSIARLPGSLWRTWESPPMFTSVDLKTIEGRMAARKRRQEDQIEQDTQRLLVESPYDRAEFMQKLDTSSVAKYEQSVRTYRSYFANQVIGRFDLPLLPADPRSRQVYDEEKWIGYEVVLDVFPDVIAYGLLLVPKNIRPGERRPVVVCQHGLEGRPQDVIGEQRKQSYSAFAAKLAERGYVTFAPQNLYLGKDRFRTLQRKANPLGKTLFSIMVPQHQQIVNWLGTQPFVDKDRIAFYGLSYGGKSAMRIPPLVPQYSAVICSADFNDWIWKNASTRSPYSYVWTGEYEIFEWNLGSTFNYAEMAALICPRPFMVERGHFDGVASDEAVASEFAKVRHLYSARLKLPGLCEMEVFDGPHQINGVGTFQFLDRHLKHKPVSGR